jgi:hypothetical protein
MEDNKNEESSDMTLLNNKVLSNEKFVIAHIEGGLGKNIAFTALIDGINKKYPDRKLVLVCSYPQIFLYHPNIYRVYGMGSTPYFYDDFIKNKDTIILKHDPYNHGPHIKQEQNLIKSWYEVFDLEYEGQLPVLFTNYRMIEIAKEKWSRNKPILVLQTNGGPHNSQNQNNYNYSNIKSWSRDIPNFVAEKIIKAYSETHHIYQICNTKENVLENTEPIIESTNNFELISILLLSDKRILIDSFLQHASAALKIPSVVLWNGTNPKVFGYDIHKNILPSKEKMLGFKNITAYMSEYELWGDPIQCPWHTNDIYDINEIIESAEKLIF